MSSRFNSGLKTVPCMDCSCRGQISNWCRLCNGTGEFTYQVECKFGARCRNPKTCQFKHTPVWTTADMVNPFEEVNKCPWWGSTGLVKHHQTQPHLRKICRFFGTPNGCRNGDDCPYFHVNPETSPLKVIVGRPHAHQ